MASFAAWLNLSLGHCLLKSSFFLDILFPILSLDILHLTAHWDLDFSIRWTGAHSLQSVSAVFYDRYSEKHPDPSWSINNGRLRLSFAMSPPRKTHYCTPLQHILLFCSLLLFTERQTGMDELCIHVFSAFFFDFYLI